MANSLAIIGGGVIGMLLAREIAQAGWRVDLYERGECGREASWAGGGIVSPLYPWRYDAAVTALAAWSQGFYPRLAHELLDESGIDPEFSPQGMLTLSVKDEAQALAWAEQVQSWLVPVTAADIYGMEPQLRAGFQQALHMPAVASIRNPRLLKALRASLAHNPLVQVHEHTAVSSLQVENGRIRGLQTSRGLVDAEQVVITTGAWTEGLLQPLGIQLPVEPVRGQMILFRAEPGLLNRIVMKDGHYLIPRRDGRILCGSTLEYVGFDKSTTEEALAELRRDAYDMLPVLAEFEIEQHWAGLRPGSPQGIPYIGAVPGVAGLYVNAGQFRNGLVLAPGSVRVMADLLLKRSWDIDPTPYQLEGRVKTAG